MTELPHALGDGPVEEAYREKMTKLVKAIDEYLNVGQHGNDRAAGFVLLVFPFGDTTGRCNFMSNGADRKDLTALLQEMISRFDGQPQHKPGTA